MSFLSLSDVYRARQRIAGHASVTPLVASAALSAKVGAPVYLKLETLQPTGSFKLRGATHALAELAAQRVTRVVTASTGNHGRAVAHAARALGIEAAVCMSSLVPANKVDAVAALGARVVIAGDSQDDAQAEARRLVRDDGYAYVPPFDDPRIIAGQATIGVEILEALPDAATLVIPLSGGGLFGGVAFAAKAIRPSIRTIGVSMARGAAMHASLAAGRPIDVDELPTLADSLGGGIGVDNRYTFALTRALADDVVLLDEDAIARGIAHAYRDERLVVEGAGAVGIAALLDERIARGDGPIVVVVSGANIDMAVHRRLVSEN
ncbi:hydroxyectoine utilization dehydratase EutB [Burkholderia dolosa]|jgi:threonine dehydratase|uniref:hydroxyectoine utilization dehydratase EutB n=1 Tax=Burkholderia dolosa TaxID=152500 RepID=UPI0015910797|nr:hydroxyectoine utilization dehydratase EutB [Burkholderia dolosa]MBR8061033.1 hydroxyectoine utilization dehydratase EutB [Burkholderia dolosa]MBR8303949.1 hydroxyectoine utilization dehydratase EutB [Burkholderia dolosa]MBR8459783.1 hydroxyectoine utilization dehydratase EutB [Burkholderia dolosa]MBY4755352.1 hydroxyectoine utilization dehydratase EutB [Burkholderia dolosa]MBY4831863.1 hydroxyectoine utilization dehydratase EutB [Burkholderia dolosa]